MLSAFCTKMQKLQWTGLALVLLFPVLARAQSPEERIDAAISRARDIGIPVSLLESKRAEGQAKGVPMERIAAAIQTRLQHLERAQQALNRGASDVDAPQLSVAADAIGAGVSEAVLSEIASATTRERRSVAFAALTYLVSKEGLASNVALARVKEALAKGPEALANLPKGSAAAPGRSGEAPGAQGNRASPGRPDTVGAPSAVPPPGQTDRPDPPGQNRSNPGRGNARGK
jgi:hypothetical protein